MTEIRRPGPHGRRAPDMPPVLEESAFTGRRELLKALGYGGAMAALLGTALARQEANPAVDPERKWLPDWTPAGGKELYPAKRNEDFESAGRPITPEGIAGSYNNFYEFFPGKAGPVYRHVKDFRPDPWKVEIAGLVEEPREVDADELAQIAPLEERVYRFRCVEAWSMVVPWTGLPLAKLVEWCRPKPEAKFVKFTSFMKPEIAPGQKRTLRQYPWPYYEALRLDEARHPLAMLVTGIYGHGLPAQHGAPLRVIVPWKYGYKSPKSFVKIEFTSRQPGTFWSDLQPREYPFLSNVEPEVPHPRWSQAKERDLATGDRIPTKLYNGYDEVAKLYAE